MSKHWMENITFHGLAYPKLTWGLPTLSLTTNSSRLLWEGLPCPLWCQYPKSKPFRTDDDAFRRMCTSDMKWSEHRHSSCTTHLRGILHTTRFLVICKRLQEALKLDKLIKLLFLGLSQLRSQMLIMAVPLPAALQQLQFFNWRKDVKSRLNSLSKFERSVSIIH